MVVTINQSQPAPGGSLRDFRAVSKPNPFAFRYSAIQPRALTRWTTCSPVAKLSAGPRCWPARRAVPEEVRRARRCGCATTSTRSSVPPTSCAYLPVGANPARPPWWTGACSGAAGCCYRSPAPGADGTPRPCGGGIPPGRCAMGRFGLLEPAEPGCRRGRSARPPILVPALAVDRSGVRLNRGGGGTTTVRYRCRAPGASRSRWCATTKTGRGAASEPHDVRMTPPSRPGNGLVVLGEPPAGRRE